VLQFLFIEKLPIKFIAYDAFKLKIIQFFDLQEDQTTDNFIINTLLSYKKQQFMIIIDK